MQVSELESLPEVQVTARVLGGLEARGLKEAAIAAGWTRTLIAGGDTKDIDVSYVGEVHFDVAQKILAQVLEDVNPPNKDMWDIKGIWNAELAHGIKHTADNFLLYYLNSIDSVYLASDGKLHDPTGFGFEDAQTKTLRINDYDLASRVTTPREEVNVCLENCRRLAKFNWTPTHRTIERLTRSVPRWQELTDLDKEYFVARLKTKYTNQERHIVKPTYDLYGWGFIFDL